MASAPVLPRSNVWPSGSAAASAFTPMVWPAPGRLLTTTAWPSGADSCSATSRVTTSAELPAAVATMILTGLLGYAAAGSFAEADPGHASTEAMATARNVDGIDCRIMARLRNEDRNAVESCLSAIERKVLIRYLCITNFQGWS